MEFQKEEFKYLWKVYAAELLRGVGAFIVPFMIIFLQGKSLTLGQIGILLATFSVTNFFLEIPTGIIADRYGRKFSAILGFIVDYLAFFFMIFTHSYFFLLVLYFFHGVGFTLTSGAYDAWIYEYLKSHKKEKYMHNFYSRKISFSYLGLVLSGLIGGFLVQYFDLSWLIVLDTAFGVFFLYFVLQIPDPPIFKEKKDSEFKKLFQIPRYGLLLIKNNRNLLLLVLATMFFTFVGGAKELLSQPVYIALGTPLSYLGYIAAFSGFLIAIAPNLLLNRSKTHPKRMVILFSVLELLLVLSLFFTTNYFLFALLLTLSYLCGTIISPISDTLFQHSLKTEVRAVTRSILEMAISFAYFIVFMCFGVLADTFGPQIILALSAFFILPAIVCYALIKD